MYFRYASFDEFHTSDSLIIVSENIKLSPSPRTRITLRLFSQQKQILCFHFVSRFDGAFSTIENTRNLFMDSYVITCAQIHTILAVAKQIDITKSKSRKKREREGWKTKLNVIGTDFDQRLATWLTNSELCDNRLSAAIKTTKEKSIPIDDFDRVRIWSFSSIHLWIFLN